MPSVELFLESQLYRNTWRKGVKGFTGCCTPDSARSYSSEAALRILYDNFTQEPCCSPNVAHRVVAIEINKSGDDVVRAGAHLRGNIVSVVGVCEREASNRSSSNMYPVQAAFITRVGGDEQRYQLNI